MPDRWRDKLLSPVADCFGRRSRSSSPASDHSSPRVASHSRSGIQPPYAQNPSYSSVESSRPPPQPSGPSGSAFQPQPESYGLFIFDTNRPSGDYNVDIVAVHGLGGHWEKTWTDTKNNKLWLRDFLPYQFPKARIMSYGYNSETAFSKGVTDINDEAEMLLDKINGKRLDNKTRPIIFISHSLGGIVVKKALIIAHERSSVYRELLSSVRGSVFFGVPHRGADLAYWATFAANIIQFGQLGSGTNTNFVTALKKNSPTFAEISQQFVERATHFNIRTFFETEKLRGQLIVERDSARLGLANEIAVGIAGTNHRTICKFSDIESEKYSTVWTAIKILLDSAAIGVASTSMPLSEKESECLRSLYTSNYKSHWDRVPTPVEGTCKWFFRHETFKIWRNERASSLLWVTADPGCGKSVLSSFLVDKLQSAESQAMLSGTVCYFFFKDDNEQQKSAEFALCALLHQLLSQQNPLISHAVKEFNAKGQQCTKEISTLWEIFSMVVADPGCGNVICVIDGLDECEERTRNQFLDYLARLYTRSNKRPAVRGQNMDTFLKVILTSRPYQSIDARLSKPATIRLRAEFETGDTTADIELVVNARVEELASMWKLNGDLKDGLKHKLSKGADRTFLWLSLVLNILETTPRASNQEFERILNDLPEDLNAVYEKILGNSPDPAEARKILHIVVAAVRPFTVQEMNIALAIQPGHLSMKDLESHLKHDIAKAVKELCGHFIRVIDSKIYLVHQTAKEFLIGSPGMIDTSGETWKQALDPAESNSVIANICILYLLSTDFETTPLQNGDVEEVNRYTGEHLFLDYAAKNWTVHVQDAGTSGGAKLIESTLEVCNSKSIQFLTWFQVYLSTVPRDIQCSPQVLTDLMVASYIGCEAAVQLLLERGGDVNEQVDEYGGALNMAALREQRDAVQLLLNNGANFYIGKQEFTDLSRVSESGYIQ